MHNHLFLSTIIGKLSGAQEWITRVKNLIVFPGLLILMPAIALTGITDFSFAKNRNGHLVNHKKKRMPFVGANGFLILMPAAIYLD